MNSSRSTMGPRAVAVCRLRHRVGCGCSSGGVHRCRPPVEEGQRIRRSRSLDSARCASSASESPAKPSPTPRDPGGNPTRPQGRPHRRSWSTFKQRSRSSPRSNGFRSAFTTSADCRSPRSRKTSGSPTARSNRISMTAGTGSDNSSWRTHMDDWPHTQLDRLAPEIDVDSALAGFDRQRKRRRRRVRATWVGVAAISVVGGLAAVQSFVDDDDGPKDIDREFRLDGIDATHAHDQSDATTGPDSTTSPSTMTNDHCGLGGARPTPHDCQSLRCVERRLRDQLIPTRHHARPNARCDRCRRSSATNSNSDSI